MTSVKMILVFLANILGFSVYFLGILEVNGWKQNIMFVVGIIFMAIKIVNAILDLVKKKHYWTRRLNYQKTEGKIININPSSPAFILNKQRIADSNK